VQGWFDQRGRGQYTSSVTSRVSCTLHAMIAETCEKGKGNKRVDVRTERSHLLACCTARSPVPLRGDHPRSPRFPCARGDHLRVWGCLRLSSLSSPAHDMCKISIYFCNI
jgi:hypothetical protein